MPNPLFASLTAEPGSHPSTGELRDYAAGLLPPAAQQRLEAHTLACPRCADALAGWQQSPAAPADAAVARLRQRLRQRVQQPDPVGEVAPPPAVVPTGTGHLPQGTALRRWAAAAAVAGLSVVGLWAWQHHGGEELAQPAVATETPTPGTDPAPDVAATAPAQPAAPTPETAPETAPAPRAEAAPALAAAPVPVATATTTPTVAAVVRPTSPAVARARPVAAAPSTPAIASTAASGTARLGEEAAADAPAADALNETAANPPSVAYNAPAKAKDLKANPPVPLTDDAQADRRAAAAGGRAHVARALPNTATRTSVGAAASPTALPAPAPIAPAPVGGWLALRERLRRQAANFDPAENAGRLTGTVHLRLLVGADGRVQESKILRGLRADYDAEALRLATETAPRWQPGLANGRRAVLPVEITVPF